MAISLKGFNNLCATFKTNTNVENMCVSLSGNNEVKLATINEDFIGICVSKRGNCASVLMQGYVEMSYSGSDPTLGYVTLAANSKGGVTVTENANVQRKRLVLNVDKVNKTVGFIL